MPSPQNLRFTRISHKLEMQRSRGAGVQGCRGAGESSMCLVLSPLPLCSSAQGFERCGEKSGFSGRLPLGDAKSK
ncbi:MAG: hypothetical protein V7L23_33645 [Nostoc sp.]|uniref:hypothetical protein n=1 Tax=Nostoc sp. TaxID=1180 RepID=UPI002FF15FBF